MKIKSMIQKSKVLRNYIPKTLKIRLLKAHQRIILYYGLREFRNNYSNLNGHQINKLIYGWGNQGYSSSINYIKAIVEHAIYTDGPILECGSGLSTILVGIIAQQRNIKVYSLENNIDWGQRTKFLIQKLKINNVILMIDQLKNYGDFDWYNPRQELLPTHFPLVICDGPPGTTLGGRIGLVPVMKERLVNSRILLDDYNREAEKSVVEKWKINFNITVEEFGEVDKFARITLK